MRRFLLPAMVAVSLVLAPAAAARDTTTQTIRDANGDNRLEAGPGESYIVRTDLSPAKAARTRTRESRIFFGQLTDLHVVDEESPLRVEYLDKLGEPLTGAYRPQEAMTTQVLTRWSAACAAPRARSTAAGSSWS